jgi:UDP-N-acetylglucosamine diphosphorylase / glucose-1-phosphate thymidylyltransferase / UDP-N-acetylgalactosamine diphosphorylase / glucosamine-1-phosphate N-acetyltransferase / galactosamine-1-phosphate N-acetyltransferase
MKVCVYEDAKYENLYPLVLIRPVFELRCGMLKLWEKMKRAFPEAEFTFFVRDYLKDAWSQKLGAKVNDSAGIASSETLFINGRTLWSGIDTPLFGQEEVGVVGETVVYVRAKAATIQKTGGTDANAVVNALASKLPKKELSVKVIEFPWDLIHANPAEITADYKKAGKKGIHGTVHPMAAILGDKENELYIGKGADIHPMAVLDASNGPIFIDEGAIVFPHTRVEGPSFIGKKTQLVGGKIREGCSIGPVCRVGGEVEESIFHSYSNKYHDGFIGHAYICEWVNLGALTTNSDLKNDYSSVEVYVKGQLIDSKDTKVGSFIGDHTKTGIGSAFNTGTVVGMMCNLLPSGDLMPKYIPSFCWYFREKFSKGLGIKAGLTTARIAMGRRKVELTEADEAMIKCAFELTKGELMEYVRKK